MDSSQFDSFVPVYDDIPASWDEARTFLVEQLKRLAEAANTREIGWYLDLETVSGKQFIPGQSGEYRTILRYVLDFGALPNTTAKSVAHGLKFDSSFTLISLSACATDQTNLKALAIPYASNTASNAIELKMDATNITITTAADYSSYGSCYVTIEYTQET